MKHFFFFFILFLSSPTMAQTPQKDYVGTYSFTKHTIPGSDQPSRCDCDYKKIILTLNEDATFQYIHQKGRISPNQNVKYGTWQLEKGMIILQTTHKSRSSSNGYKSCTEGPKEASKGLDRFQIESTHRICQEYKELCLQK